jgi:hypothetical protein
VVFVSGTGRRAEIGFMAVFMVVFVSGTGRRAEIGFMAVFMVVFMAVLCAVFMVDSSWMAAIDTQVLLSVSIVDERPPDVLETTCRLRGDPAARTSPEARAHRSQAPTVGSS